MSTTVLAPATPSEALSRLDEILDLSSIRMKLADPEEGRGFSERQLDLREAEYCNFLALHMAFPDAEIVPCKIVDEIWHQHILDTHAYHHDCATIFGEYLHHFPYFGMRGEADAQALHDAYAETIALYREAFGEPPKDTWISADAASCKRTACKPQKCR